MTSKLRYVGPALLASAGLWLGLSWERIPEQWVIHWGPHGRADGFAHKSLVGVFLLLLIGVAIWALFELIASVLERTGPLPELSRVTALPLRLLSIGIAAVFATLSLALPLLRPERPYTLIVAVLVLAFAPFAAGLVHFARVVTRLKRAGHPELEGWSGLIYRNAADKRLLVPKLSGLGYTLNFAHPAAWWILGLLLLPGTLIALLVLVLR